MFTATGFVLIALSRFASYFVSPSTIGRVAAFTYLSTAIVGWPLLVVGLAMLIATYLP